MMFTTRPALLIAWGTTALSALPAPAQTTAPTSLPTGPVITGIVLNHYGGGVEGAAVRIESLDASAEDPPLAETVTNSMGDIEVQLPAPVEGSVRVRISKPGHTDYVEEIELGEDAQPFIDASLAGAAKLSGTIRAEANNRPVAGAGVRCENGGRTLNAASDDKGRYEFDSIFEGPATLTVSAEGFAVERQTITIDAEKVTRHVQLLPERVVELTVVTDKGKPADAVAVEALVGPMQHFIEATTDAEGKATLRGIHPDGENVQIRLNGDRYVHAPEFTESIDLKAWRGSPSPGGVDQPIRKRLTIDLAARIQGRVVAEGSDRPVVGVRIIAGRDVLWNMPMAWTTIDGSYELPGLRPGTNLLTFQHDHFAPRVEEIDLTADEVKMLDISLPSGRPIEGVVVGTKDASPLANVDVAAINWKGYATLALRTFTDDEGKFSIPNAPEGDVEFTFFLGGYGPPKNETLTGGKTDYRIELEPAPESDSEAPAGRPRKLKVGQPVPDLTMTATDGTRYKLSALRGKYVFIDCWATWCGPCVGEIPNVKKLREATQDNADFVMIGVSLDNDRDALNAGVKKHEITWPQVFGPKSGAKEVFDTLDGTGIPYTCLIGPDGTLLAQHLRGPGLTDEVVKHLPKSDEKQDQP